MVRAVSLYLCHDDIEGLLDRKLRLLLQSASRSSDGDVIGPGQINTYTVKPHFLLLNPLPDHGNFASYDSPTGILGNRANVSPDLMRTSMDAQVMWHDVTNMWVIAHL